MSAFWHENSVRNKCESDWSCRQSEMTANLTGVAGSPKWKNGEFLTQIRVGGEFLTQVPIAAAHGCSSWLQQIVRLQEIVLRSTGTMLQLMEYLPFAMSCSTTAKE